MVYRYREFEFERCTGETFNEVAMRFLLILVFGLFCTAARADGLPILQLDTGGHMAKIKSVLFTPDGKYLVSAGDDKVIRIWDWRA